MKFRQFYTVVLKFAMIFPVKSLIMSITCLWSIFFYEIVDRIVIALPYNCLTCENKCQTLLIIPNKAVEDLFRMTQTVPCGFWANHDKHKIQVPNISFSHPHHPLKNLFWKENGFYYDQNCHLTPESSSYWAEKPCFPISGSLPITPRVEKQRTSDSVC